MSSEDASELKEHGIWARHEKGQTHHADGKKLSWNGEDKKPGTLAPLILSCSIAHG